MKEVTNVLTGEKILSLLVDLYADQYGVNVKYHIEHNEKEEETQCQQAYK